jgi:hypothetical protein
MPLLVESQVVTFDNTGNTRTGCILFIGYVHKHTVSRSGCLLWIYKVINK